MARTRPTLFRAPNDPPPAEGAAADTEQTEDSEKEKPTEFSVDCYLLDYSDEISKDAAAMTTPFNGVYFSSKQDQGISGQSSFGSVLASLSGRKSLEELSEITSLQLAGIYPIIRIFRVDSDAANKTNKKREFIFNKNLNGIFQVDSSNPQIGSLTGCGIKNFSYTLAGTNPVEAERSVDVSMTLFFSSPLEFIGLDKDNNLTTIQTLRDKGDLYDPSDGVDPTGKATDNVGTTTQYITLIERPKPKDQKLDYKAKDFRLIAEISYGVNNDKDVIPEKLRQRLLNLTLTLDLSLINHELSFTEEGTLELKINYYGSLQQYMNDPETDYFHNEFKNDHAYGDSITSVESANKAVEEAKKQAQCNNTDVTRKKLEDTQTKLKDELTKQQESFEAAKSKVYSSFISNLFKVNSLHTFTVKDDDVTKWIDYINGVPGATRPVFPGNVAKGTQPPIDEARETAEEASSESKEDIQSTIDTKRETKVKIDEELAITFFYFGDLLQNIAESYKLGTTTNNRIILGDIEYQVDGTGTTRKYNIGEVPIDVDLFQAWFLEKVIKPGKTKYRFDNLLRDLVNGLLRPALDTNCILQSIQNKSLKIDLNFTSFTIEAENEPISRDDNGIINGVLDIVKGNKIYNYFCIYATESLCSRKGNVKKDNNDGVMHLYVGKNNGLVTSIKFKRVDQPYLKEAKATRQGFTPLSSLRDIYNCDVSMFGNNIFYPGMSVFIHPPYYFGDSTLKNKTLSNIMGIGGYYSIIKVTTDIADGKAETKLDCYYQSSGDGCGDLKGRCPPQ